MPAGNYNLPTRDGEQIRKGRVSPALRTAIILIVHEALTVAEAAKRTGYRPESLAKALIKPHVKSFRADVKRAWLASKTERAWLTVAELAESGCSEDVRLKAAKVFIDADEAARQAMPEQARQLIQIVANGPVNLAQLPVGQLPGVYEAAPIQRDSVKSSNSFVVGRGESDDAD